MLLIVAACGSNAGNSPSAPPPCDQTCEDQIGVRGTREVIKLVYNLGLQGKPVGNEDAMAPCPLGGSAHVFGTASSNAIQGSTEVQLTYVLDHCVYQSVSTTPEDNYSLTVSGTFVEMGTLAVQPSATTALGIHGTGVTVSGTVDDPAVPYDDENCVLDVQQDGNDVSGTLCTRTVGVSL
jgi:hypothetical protein